MGIYDILYPGPMDNIYNLILRIWYYIISIFRKPGFRPDYGVCEQDDYEVQLDHGVVNCDCYNTEL